MGCSLFVDEDYAVAFCQDQGLLVRKLECIICSSPCKKTIRRGVKVFRCANRNCDKHYSIRRGSFFEGTPIPISKLLHLIYVWSSQKPIRNALVEVVISTATTVEYYRSLRRVCTKYLTDHPVLLGGPGKIVEIGEFQFGSQRYRDSELEGHWVLAGVEQCPSGGCFMVEVESRDVETFLPIIVQRTARGTTIMSDDLTIANAGNSRDRTFLDPLNCDNFTYIKSLCAEFSKFMKQLNAVTTARTFFRSYLDHFCVKRMLVNSNGDVFFHTILELIAEQSYLPIGIDEE